MVGILRHRQPKGSETDRPYLNHRATSRLYTFFISKRFGYVSLSIVFKRFLSNLLHLHPPFDHETNIQASGRFLLGRGSQGVPEVSRLERVEDTDAPDTESLLAVIKDGTRGNTV